MEKDIKESAEIQNSNESECSSEGTKGRYIAPNCESHNPLKIMSKWEDQSSDLEF